MSEQTPVSHPKERLLSTDVKGFDSLAELALDMRSSWNHATDRVWREFSRIILGSSYRRSRGRSSGVF
jgi:glycogen phosphorylase